MNSTVGCPQGTLEVTIISRESLLQASQGISRLTDTASSCYFFVCPALKSLPGRTQSSKFPGIHIIE